MIPFPFRNRQAEDLLAHLDDPRVTFGDAELRELSAVARRLEAGRRPLPAADSEFTARLRARLVAGHPAPNAPTMKLAFLKFAAVGALAVALLAIGAKFSGNGGLSGIVPNRGFKAQLAYASGVVEIRDGDAWHAAVADETFSAGDAVRTGADSRAILNLDDGSVVRLAAEAEVSFSEISGSAIRISQAAGDAYYRVDKNPGRTFTVGTPGTDVTALGTAFGVKRDPQTEKKVIIKVVESKVKVEIRKDGDKLEKEVPEGQELSIDLEKPIEQAVAYTELTAEKISSDEFAKWNVEEDAQEEFPLGKFSDITPPKLTIENPANGATTKDDRVTLAGATDPDAKVTVNGEEAANEDGAFKTDVVLALGKNVISVVATDQSGNPAKAAIGVTRLPKETASAGIYLKTATVSNGIKLTWTVGAGADTSRGFKILKSTEPNPAFPSNKIAYLPDPGARSWLLEGSGGGSYHFRICAWDGGDGCTAYSNDAVGTKPESSQTSGGYQATTSELRVSATPAKKGISLSWSACAAAGFKGYKVVRSETDPDPYYPKSGYLIYITDRSNTAFVDTGAVSGKSYYYRICALESDGPTLCGNVVRVSAP